MTLVQSASQTCPPNLRRRQERRVVQEDAARAHSFSTLRWES